MSVPANVIQIKDRRVMDEGKQASRDYFEYKRLLRKVLSSSEYVIFEILCDCANEQNDGWCWPNLDTICELAGDMGRATVVRALVSLEKQGVLQVQHAPRVPGNQKPNYYKPMAKPEGTILETLTATWFKKRTTRNTTKYSSSKTELRKITRSTKSALREKDTTSSSKNDIPVVSKLNSNVSKEENVSNINGASAAPQRQTPLIDVLETKYRDADSGHGKTGNPAKDKAGVIAEAFQETFKKPADIPRLMRMAYDLNSGWLLIQRILSCTGQKVHDDPHDYLQKGIGKNRTKKSGTYPTSRQQDPETIRIKAQLSKLDNVVID